MTGEDYAKAVVAASRTQWGISRAAMSRNRKQRRNPPTRITNR